MRISRGLAALLTIILLSACSGNGGNEGRRARGNAMLERIPTIDVSSRQFSRAIDLKAAGKCDEAAPLFYRMALRGQGFELAQYHLADCLFRIAPPSATSSAFLDALLWMRRAAEAGSPEAQGRLARVYAEGPAGIQDTGEAAMWWALYEANPARKRPGFVPPADANPATIEPLIESRKAEGADRAAAFEKTVWIPPSGVMPSPDRPRGEGGIDMLEPDSESRRRPQGG